ncbi:ribonuclease H-like domain-containing protein [Lactarius hengduanensis]|nr:ribonuclease H-like domain-containing protein [Lactarius hengduanensis]
MPGRHLITRFPRSHTGVNLAIAFAEVLGAFGIKDKVLSVTTDNTSNNDTMIKHLSTIVDTFPSAANQTRCFAHIISISTKLILKQFDIPKTNLECTELEAWEADDDAEDQEDDQPLDPWLDLHEGLTEEELGKLNESIQPVRLMLMKLRRLAFTLKNSMTILLPKSCDDNLCKYELLPAEWKIAGELCDILKIFKDATMYFSRGMPNLTTVIPAMDHIDKVLATASDSPYQFGPSIRAALAIGKNAMNRYYNKPTNLRLLHPRHKLNFKKHKWEDAWIQAAHKIVQDKFAQSYKSVEGVNNDEDDTENNASGDEATYLSTKNIFDDLPDLMTASSDHNNELDRYLVTGVEDMKDALSLVIESPVRSGFFA